MTLTRVFSTSVEVFPDTFHPDTLRFCLLHVRGGVSAVVTAKILDGKSSPRPWRCFCADDGVQCSTAVFSTSVEVFLSVAQFCDVDSSLLHVRGGVSFSSCQVGIRCLVFSTSVEVFPRASTASGCSGRLLHVRGGVSYTVHGFTEDNMSSPRPWRCFLISKAFTSQMKVFFTSVEVFPRTRTTRARARSLLHVRGGVSERDARGGTRYTSSPRPWRCFHHGLVHFGTEQVFSTSVEVFPPYAHAVSHTCRLLHVRGGVAISRRRPSSRSLSSPRPWRCFLHVDDLQKPKWVFSTSVEVFRMNCFTASFVGSLLHVRGGVSLFKRPPVKAIESSPRPWRCFRRHAN